MAYHLEVIGTHAERSIPGRNSKARLKQLERWKALLTRLPDVATGKARPAPAEALEFAWLCWQPFQKRYASAAHLYAEAFAGDPELADEPHRHPGHRYMAACAAVWAAAGEGREMAALGPEEWVYLTEMSYRWLREDLAAWGVLAQNPEPWAVAVTIERMNKWKQTTDLATVRDPAWLAAMPEPDRKRWQAFWADVDALLARVSQPAPAKKP